MIVLAKERIELTQYEKARLVGARALQLSMGAPPLTKVPDDLISAVHLSFLEFEKGVVPLKIMRSAASPN